MGVQRGRREAELALHDLAACMRGDEAALDHLLRPRELVPDQLADVGRQALLASGQEIP